MLTEATRVSTDRLKVPREEDVTTISDADTNYTQSGSEKDEDSLTEIRTSKVSSNKPSRSSRHSKYNAAQSATTSSSQSNNTHNPDGIVMIFDWDDTILPTSYLARQGLRVDGPNAPPAIQAALDVYSNIVRATLAEARRLGTVFIVTNAETGWIELTVKKFMPLLARDISQIRQLSARSAFEPQGISNPFQWKERAFQLVIDGHYSRLAALNNGAMNRHVISFGDSSHEREAVLRVCATMGPQTRCKSLKFMERPDLEHLTKEQNLIRDCLNQIVNHVGPLDLCIQCQQN